MVHKGALQITKGDPPRQPSCAASVSVQDPIGGTFMGKGVGERFTAAQRVADALKGAGTDQSRGFADQKASVPTVKDTASGTRTQDGTGLSPNGGCDQLSRDESVGDQLLLLRLKGASRVVRLKGTAEDEGAVLKKDPGAAARGGAVKQAGVIRIGLPRGKPLLDGGIALNTVIGKK